MKPGSTNRCLVTLGLRDAHGKHWFESWTSVQGKQGDSMEGREAPMLPTRLFGPLASVDSVHRIEGHATFPLAGATGFLIRETGRPSA